MKKIIVALLSILIYAFSNTFAAQDDEYNLQNVFKIYSYSYDEVSGLYAGESSGSSVYIGKNKVLTNAHVVLDENNEPYGNYELCLTYSFKENPSCFNYATLEYYDIENDIALLTFTSDNSVSTILSHREGVFFSAEEPSIGDGVKIFGYPTNGGDSINFSQGKISGYTDGLYKTDAYVDYGNSGGGAFNEEGYFIGIPTAISTDSGAIGYIVPEEDISIFLSSSYGYKTFNGSNLNFGKFWKEEKIIRQKDSVSFPGYSLKNLSKYNYEIVGYTKSDVHDLEYYVLNYKKGDVTISIRNLDLLKSDVMYKDTWENAELEGKKLIKKYLTINGAKVYLVVVIDKKTLDAQIILSFDETLISIDGNFKKQKGLVDAVKLVLINSDFTPTQKKNTLDFKGFGLHTSTNLRAYNYLYGNEYINETILDGYDVALSFEIFDDQDIDQEGSVYSDLKTYFEEEYGENIIANELVKNTKGEVFFLTKYYNREYGAYSYWLNKYSTLGDDNGYYFLKIDYLESDKIEFERNVVEFLNSIEFKQKDLLDISNLDTISVEDFNNK